MTIFIDPDAPQKYRQQVQIVSRQPAANHPYADIELPEGVKLQYKSLHNQGTVSQVPRPIQNFQFEKELAQLVESNRPVHGSQGPKFGRYQEKPQNHEYAFVTAASQEYNPKIQQKSQYVAPYLKQTHKGQKPPQQSPAQKYQFISTEPPFKADSEQYFAEVTPKYGFKVHGTPSPKIQYYAPKEKNLQIYYQQPERPQPSEGPMKIVEAPQLQHEKPQHRLASYRQAKTQISKPQQQQIEQAEAAEQQAAQKSKEVNEIDEQSRSSIYVSQGTGHPGSAERQSAERPVNPNANRPPPKIDRPLTPEEFQALVDAGYSVVPIPVPVPVPVPHHNGQNIPKEYNPHVTQRVPHYQQFQQQAAENSQSPIVTFLRPLPPNHYPGVRGPNKSPA